MRLSTLFVVILVFTIPFDTPSAVSQSSKEVPSPEGMDSPDQSFDFLLSNPPDDVFLSGCARMDMDPLNAFVNIHTKKETLKPVEGLVKECGRFNRSWKMASVEDFAEELRTIFGNRIYFALRMSDANKSSGSEKQPHSEFALILEIKDLKRLQNIEKTVIDSQNNSVLKYEVWRFSKEQHGCMIKGIHRAEEDTFGSLLYTMIDNRFLLLSDSSDFVLKLLQAAGGG